MSEATAALTGDNGGGEGAATTAAPAAATSAAPAANAPWYGQADEATAAYIQNKGWDNPIKAIESYRNLEKFAGGSKNLLELPGPDATPDQLNAFYGKLGRPNDPTEYGIKAPEGGDPELTDWFAKTAHSAGLNAKQAQTLFNQWNEMAGGKVQAMEAQQRENSEKEIQALKREWGQGYEKQIDMGRRAVAALGFKQEQLSAYEAKLGTAEMLKLFSVLGSKMGEDTFDGGERSGSSGGFGTTPAQAQQQIADLKSDKEFMKAYMAGSKDHVAKMTRLMGLAHGA